jgi:hypothetical protein
MPAPFDYRFGLIAEPLIDAQRPLSADFVEKVVESEL